MESSLNKCKKYKLKITFVCDIFEIFESSFGRSIFLCKIYNAFWNPFLRVSPQGDDLLTHIIVRNLGGAAEGVLTGVGVEQRRQESCIWRYDVLSPYTAAN